MSCYHPLTAISLGENPENGKLILQFVKLEDKEHREDIVYIPCGKCIGCRLDYSRRWADRMMLEYDSWNGKAIFLTLTYDCRHLVDKDGKYLNQHKVADVDKKYYDCLAGEDTVCNDKCYWHSLCDRKDGSLYKRHLQLFMKSLRKELDTEKWNYRKVRFFACGEYGSWENSHRPHYHVILYGLDLDSIPDKKKVKINELKQVSYTAPLIARHWPHGYISFSSVSWNTCAYVARYVTKKALDPTTDLLNEKLSINPLFTVMSRKPGLGMYYLEEHPDCLDNTSIYLSTADGVRKVSIPRYFVNQLELTDREKYENIIAQRSLYAYDTMLSKLSQTDLPFYDYLEVEEKKTLEAIKALKRHKEKGVNSLY